MVLRRSGDHLVGAAVALLLVLTAWGNAGAMIIVSGLSLAVSLVVFRGRIGRGVPFVIAAAAAVAAVIAIVLLVIRS
jgi:hypothetical protein